MADFDPNWALLDYSNSSLDSSIAHEMTHKVLCSIEEVPYWLWRSFVKFQGQAGKNHQFWPELSVSRL